MLGGWMESFFRDIRHALRPLRKSPGFTVTAILTLALGIGATTAIFSIVVGVLLRPLPFADPARLVTLGDTLEGAPHFGEASGVTAPGVVSYMRDTHGFSALGGYQGTAYELSGQGEPAQINAARMTASTFQVLGIHPLIGRIFSGEEDEGRQQVAVLSYQTWRSRFHGDAGVLGRTVLLDRKPYAIVGVMPRDFEFPLVPGQLNRSELWVPMSLTPAELISGAGNWGYSIVGRLKPGVSAAQAQQDAAGAAREIMSNFPPALRSRRIHPVVVGLQESTVAEARPLVRTLFLAAIVVLFIACANLAGLLLVRVLRRRREISVRLALGASGAAVLRQSLAESLLLSTSGGLLGLILAWVGLRVGVSSLPETLPRVGSIHLDGQVVVFALGLAVLTGLLCGLVPALSAARTGVSEALKEGGRTGSAGGGHARLRSALVVAELAVALVLLTASGLLLRSYREMRTVSLGFRADHTLTASYSLPRQQYSKQAAVDAFNVSLLSRLEQLPGVQAVGMTTLLPASGLQSLATFTPDGYVPPKGAGLNLAWVPEVMGNYFQAQGIALLRGRAFTPADRDGSPLVAIVNRSLAERYWPGQDPIGKRLHRGPAEATLPWLTIVGEIEGVKQLADTPIEEEIYIAASQAKGVAGSFATPDMLTGNNGSIVMRGHVPAEQMADGLRAAVRAIDPQLPLTQLESMDGVIEEGQASRRFNTALISAFAGVSVLLGLLGIYSVIAFSTALRSQEMAIRLALGSPRSRVMRLILLSGGQLGLAGCSLGAVAALLITRLLRSLLFQVDALDPMVLAAATFSILLLAVLASVIPANRAASIQPVDVLRSE
jgi:putative ABC transport system permease protein